jgi:hypothetical protein
VPRKYPFYPSWDGKKASPVTEKLMDLCKRRWGFSNLGIYANRQMRGSNNLSVHATGFAVDIGYGTGKDARAKAVQAWDWFLKYSEELRICEIHDYAYKEWGRGYRCSRGAGTKGVKIFTATDNAGTPGPTSTWLHVEVSNDWESAEAFEAAWRALPKP